MRFTRSAAMNSNNSLPLPVFGSDGAANFVAALKVNGKKEEANFPRFWDRGNVRAKETRDAEGDPNRILRQWFRKLIGTGSDWKKRIDACTIEENIACVASIDWKGNELTFCRMQVIVTNGGNLRDLYLEATKEASEGTESTDTSKAKTHKVSAVYYRLELDADQPGSLFMEPQPHVHTVPEGSPRFSFLPPDTEFLPLAFLEFIYLNHNLKKWHAWAKRVCELRKPDLDFEALLQIYDHGEGKLWRERNSWKSTIKSVRDLVGLAAREKLANFPKLSQELRIVNRWPTWPQPVQDDDTGATTE